MKNQAAITQHPSPISAHQAALPEKVKIKSIAKHFRKIMEILGLDLTNDSLKDTPERVAKMYVEEIFSGLDYDNFPEIKTFDAPYYGDKASMVLVSNIALTSFCEHHFLPMFGKAHVAYLPNKQVIGLSKINRIVKYFCRRPQLQERLTAQIGDSLCYVLDTEHVAVRIEAEHLCVATRGVEDQHSATTTQVFLGKFNTDPELRREFFNNLSFG